MHSPSINLNLQKPLAAESQVCAPAFGFIQCDEPVRFRKRGSRPGSSNQPLPLLPGDSRGFQYKRIEPGTEQRSGTLGIAHLTASRASPG